VTVLAARFGAGDISLSEVQTVCLRLWQSDNPSALLAEKGPQGLLEDYLGEALDGMPAQQRPAAIALLAQMVTSAGTRNVISAGDLVQRVQEQEGGDITPSLLEQALESLSQSRLVRRERRRDLDLYEIASEFLVPWITRRRDEFRQWQDRRRERRLRLILVSVLAVILLTAGDVALYQRFYHAPFQVTGVVLSQTHTGCAVDVTGRITTNGSAGTISYQWVFQPQEQAPQPLSQSVAAGQHAVYVTVAVQGQGQGSASQKVTLQILGPDQRTISTDVVISC